MSWYINSEMSWHIKSEMSWHINSEMSWHINSEIISIKQVLLTYQLLNIWCYPKVLEILLP
jgi:hypothetical protein